jgi:predicted membrane protein
MSKTIGALVVGLVFIGSLAVVKIKKNNEAKKQKEADEKRNKEIDELRKDFKGVNVYFKKRKVDDDFYIIGDEELYEYKGIAKER